MTKKIEKEQGAQKVVRLRRKLKVADARGVSRKVQAARRRAGSHENNAGRARSVVHARIGSQPAHAISAAGHARGSGMTFRFSHIAVPMHLRRSGEAA